MNIHHTKNKRDLGVLKAQADLCEKGYLLCFPMSKHAPFDLVVYKDAFFKRVQVKTRSIKNGFVTVRFEHSHSDSKGVHTNKANVDEIDIYIVSIVLIITPVIISTIINLPMKQLSI